MKLEEDLYMINIYTYALLCSTLLDCWSGTGLLGFYETCRSGWRTCLPALHCTGLLKPPPACSIESVEYYVDCTWPARHKTIKREREQSADRAISCVLPTPPSLSLSFGMTDLVTTILCGLYLRSGTELSTSCKV